MEKTTIDKKAFVELMKVKEELDLVVESIELMNDKEFVKSYERSKEQIKKRDFVDWNELIKFN